MDIFPNSDAPSESFLKGGVSVAEFEKCVFAPCFYIEKCDSLLSRLKIRRIFTEYSLYSLDEGE